MPAEVPAFENSSPKNSDERNNLSDFHLDDDVMSDVSFKCFSHSFQK